MARLSESHCALGCTVALFTLLVSGAPLSGGTIDIKAHGTASSSKILTSVEVRFDESADLSTLRLVDARGETVPHYFRPEPEPGHVGTLYWMWREVPMFHTEDYLLHYQPGQWSTTPVGDAGIGEAAMQQKVMLPNGSFEIVEEGVPTGWELENAALSQKYAYSGKNSIELNTGKARDSASYVAPSTGRVQGLVPGTRYNLSFRLLMPKPADGSVPQPNPSRGIRVSGDITYYDADGKRLNRNLIHYYPMAEDSLAQMGEWVLVRRPTPAGEGAVEAHVRISASGFDDAVYIDQVVMESVSMDEPFKFDVGNSDAR